MAECSLGQCGHLPTLKSLNTDNVVRGLKTLIGLSIVAFCGAFVSIYNARSISPMERDIEEIRRMGIPPASSDFLPYRNYSPDLDLFNDLHRPPPAISSTPHIEKNIAVDLPLIAGVSGRRILPNDIGNENAALEKRIRSTVWSAANDAEHVSGSQCIELLRAAEAASDQIGDAHTIQADYGATDSELLVLACYQLAMRNRSTDRQFLEDVVQELSNLPPQPDFLPALREAYAHDITDRRANLDMPYSHGSFERFLDLFMDKDRGEDAANLDARMWKEVFQRLPKDKVEWPTASGVIRSVLSKHEGDRGMGGVGGLANEEEKAWKVGFKMRRATLLVAKLMLMHCDGQPFPKDLSAFGEDGIDPMRSRPFEYEKLSPGNGFRLTPVVGAEFVFMEPAGWSRIAKIKK